MIHPFMRVWCVALGLFVAVAAQAQFRVEVAGGLVELDREEIHSGRLRRYYRLTESGRQSLLADIARQEAARDKAAAQAQQRYRLNTGAFGGIQDLHLQQTVATNTTLSREAVQGLPHAEEAGGLSGAPVLEASNRVIAQLEALLKRCDKAATELARSASRLPIDWCSTIFLPNCVRSACALSKWIEFVLCVSAVKRMLS